eukprot:7522724-Alexandrium_andersonii.AAC.1
MGLELGSILVPHDHGLQPCDPDSPSEERVHRGVVLLLARGSAHAGESDAAGPSGVGSETRRIFLTPGWSNDEARLAMQERIE